jgi:serine/threonine protein phosphatase PrpC
VSGTAAAVTLDAFGLTDVGKKREANEDHFVVAALSKSLELQHTSLAEMPGGLQHLRTSTARLLMVADGVGGVAGGALASSTAVQAFTEYLGQTAGCYYDFDVTKEDEFIQQLETAAQRAHERVRSYSPKGRGPATTLTMVTLVWPRGYIVHVGDSRGYHLRRGRLRQFTSDQTMGALLVDEGVMTEQQARDSGMQNVLSSAVGADFSPSVGLLDFTPGDVLLICTDGLTKHVPDERIAEILGASGSSESACRQLVDAALDGGGSDNVTVVACRMVGD